MKIKEEIIYTLIASKKEIIFLKFLLDYCYHRASKHKSPLNSQENKINELRTILSELK